VLRRWIMWTEVLAVIIIALANLICYAAHEKSLFHGHLRLPKVLLVSNRCSSPPVNNSPHPWNVLAN
jgi:hypothetical protein